MSDDLDRAVDAQIDAYRPETVPTFSEIEGRKRARDRRRMAVGAGVLSVAALGVVGLAIPALTGGGGDRLTPDRDTQVYAGQGTPEASCAYTDMPGTPCARATGPQQYSITYTDVQEYRRNTDVQDAQVKACMELPGTSRQGMTYSDPPQYGVTVTGAQAVEAFTACIDKIDNVTLSAVGISRPASPAASGGAVRVQFEVGYTAGPDGHGDADEAALRNCTSYPGGSRDLQLQSDPPIEVVSVIGRPDGVAEFRQCLEELPNTRVTQTGSAPLDRFVVFGLDYRTAVDRPQDDPALLKCLDGPVATTPMFQYRQPPLAVLLAGGTDTELAEVQRCLAALPSVDVTMSEAE